MIELEKTAPTAEAGCDGRCEVRLLQSLQKAIGDILSDHVRGAAGNARPYLGTPERGKGSDLEVEHGVRPNTGSGLQTNDPMEAVVRADSQPGASAGAAGPSRADVVNMVVDTIAEITRYPREILTPEARFDDDLGIDSLKRAEIVTALLNRFGEAPSDLQGLGPIPLTVAEMTDFAAAYFCKSAPTPASSSLASSEGNRPAGAAQLPRTSTNLGPASPQGTQELPSAGSPWIGRSVTGALFEGRVALVTGSSKSLSKVFAKQIAELGAHVIIVSPHGSEQGEQGNGRTTHLRGSLAGSQDVDRAFRQIEERFDGLDYYVHNAADEVITSLAKATEGDWEKAFRTDIVGYHLAAMRAAKLMKKSGGGRIVALSASGAHRYMEHYGVMGPVKAALESLTMYLAQEFAADNIQVNAVSACPIYGDQLSSSSDSDRVVSHRESRMHGGRLASREEISDAVVFLLTEAARKINGSTLIVDGGWSQRV
jgi:enoyl-[acyl-carrier protein] reductase III